MSEVVVDIEADGLIPGLLRHIPELFLARFARWLGGLLCTGLGRKGGFLGDPAGLAAGRALTAHE